MVLYVLFNHIYSIQSVHTNIVYCFHKQTTKTTKLKTKGKKKCQTKRKKVHMKVSKNPCHGATYRY